MIKRATLLVIVSLLLINTALAANLADYPYMFVNNGKFNAYYVVGDEADSKDVVSATVLSTALAKYPNITTEVGTSKIDDEISDITKYNAIIIGSPCEIQSAYLLQGKPEPCYKNLAASAGHIRLYENNGKYQLLITGLTPEDRYEAAKFIANKPLKDLTTKTYVIATSTGSTPQYYNRSYLNVTNNDQTNQNVVYTSANSIKNETAANNSIIRPENSSNTVKTKNIIEREEGFYEPLDKIPKRKGFFARIWAWIRGLFG